MVMKVFINKKELEIFMGARVQDALLAYSQRSFNLVKQGKMAIFDRFGNLTDLDGSLANGQHLTLKRIKIL